MKNKFNRRKAFYIALATLVAIIIWIYADLTGNPDGTPRIVSKEFKDVPIEYVDENSTLAQRGLMLLEEGTDTTVDVKLQGTRWDLAKVDRDDLLIQADLSNITATGTQTVANKSSFRDRTLSQIVSYEDIRPYTATVNIGELYKKSVDVHYEIVGNVAAGYSGGELEISPAVFEIRGQKEILDQISYAKVTLDIGTDAMATVSRELSYQYYDENGQLMNSENVHSNVDAIQVTLPVNVTKEVDLVMNFKESPGASLSNVTYKITPAKITISGDAERLRGVDSLVLADFNLVELNSAALYNYVIPVPEGCENLSGTSQATLQLSFKDMTEADITTSRIQYENLLTEGKYVDLLTLEVTVHIFGTSADVARVEPDDILVVADLTDFNNAAGSYTVPAKVLVDTTGDIGVSGNYQVRVDIREGSAPTEEKPAEEPLE